eukprot:TRINITY_DN9874_c0_g1_i1.p1 TRINITY_DN9874_c0_g1~~TRINITY_DN9874_c0_g1_i1.p1  ORF type:complete len:634 (+),score=117.22 TRINITY_DN9874_c0_g1_i1:47-1948(+)
MEADDVTKALWKDEYNWENPFEFEDLRAAFPGCSSWGYWPRSKEPVDYRKCGELNLKIMKMVLEKVGCPMEGVLSLEDHARHLFNIIDCQFGFSASSKEKHQQLSEEVYALRNRINEIRSTTFPLSKLDPVRSLLRDLKKSHSTAARAVTKLSKAIPKSFGELEVSMHSIVASVREEHESTAARDIESLQTNLHVYQDRLKTAGRTMWRYIKCMQDMVVPLGFSKPFMDSLQVPDEWTELLKEATGGLQAPRTDNPLVQLHFERKVLEDFNQLETSSHITSLTDTDTGHYKACILLINSTVCLSEILDANRALDHRVKSLQYEMQKVSDVQSNLEQELEEQKHLLELQRASKNEEEAGHALREVGLFLSANSTDKGKKESILLLCDQMQQLDQQYGMVLRESLAQSDRAVELLEFSSRLVRARVSLPKQVIKVQVPVHGKPNLTGVGRMIAEDKSRLNNLQERLERIRALRAEKWETMVKVCHMSMTELQDGDHIAAPLVRQATTQLQRCSPRVKGHLIMSLQQVNEKMGGSKNWRRKKGQSAKIEDVLPTSSLKDDLSIGGMETGTPAASKITERHVLGSLQLAMITSNVKQPMSTAKLLTLNLPMFKQSKRKHRPSSSMLPARTLRKNLLS